MKTSTKNDLLVAALLIALAALYLYRAKYPEVFLPSTARGVEPTSRGVEPTARGWVASRTADQITGALINTRCMTAPLVNPSDFPERERAEAQLCYSTVSGQAGYTVQVGVDRRAGLPVCHRECMFRISVDGTPGQLAVTDSDPTDDLRVVQVVGGAWLIDRLGRAETFRVEIPMYRDGTRTFEFAVRQLR